MNVRRILLFVCSLLLAVLLVALLVHIGKVNLHILVTELRCTNPVKFAYLMLLNATVVFLSTMKWRSVDAALRHPSDAVPSWTTAYSITSLGMALGMLLPVQLGMTTARTVGIYAYGKTLKRGTVGTLFEQSFDMVIMFLLLLSSLVAWLAHRGVLLWLVLTVALFLISLVAAKWLPFLLKCFFADLLGRAVECLCFRIAWHQLVRLHTTLCRFSEAQSIALVHVNLVRRLLILSMLRMGVVILMAEQTAKMIGVAIPLWNMAASVPFAAMANFIAITPGGVGVNEFTSVTALHLFGTPLEVATRWALANRVIMTASYFSVASTSMAVMLISRIRIRQVK